MPSIRKSRRKNARLTIRVSAIMALAVLMALGQVLWYSMIFSSGDDLTETSLEKLKKLGVPASSLEDKEHALPLWSDVTNNYGPREVVIGLDHCQRYQAQVPPDQRILAPAGLFSTGTNVLLWLLMKNCVAANPSSRRQPLVLRQVPWGKHNPFSARQEGFRKSNTAQTPVNVTNVLPVVTVRHPVTWLMALCQHSYSLAWNHSSEDCFRHLGLTYPVMATFGATSLTYPSLAHVWTRWNQEYLDHMEDYPMLFVRLEDLIFRPQTVVAQICRCVGGVLGDTFQVRTASANLGKGHGRHRTSNVVAAWIKYGKPLSIYDSWFDEQDWSIIRQTIGSSKLLSLFEYETL